jgi:hypothetical protein
MTVFHDIPKRFIPAVGNALPSLHLAFRCKGSPEVDGSASNVWLLLKNRNFGAPFGKGDRSRKSAGAGSKRHCIVFDYASHRIPLSEYLH